MKTDYNKPVMSRRILNNSEFPMEIASQCRSMLAAKQLTCWFEHSSCKNCSVHVY